MPKSPAAKPAISVSKPSPKPPNTFTSGKFRFTGKNNSHHHDYSLGKRGGGDFVKQVCIPFLDALMKNGKTARARRTIDTMRQQLSPEPGSLLDMALRELEQATKSPVKDKSGNPGFRGIKASRSSCGSLKQRRKVQGTRIVFLRLFFHGKNSEKQGLN